MKESAEKLAGKFIVIDGPDGAGKSTQLKMLADYLRSRGVSVVETHDPGGTAIGNEIRRILLDKSHEEIAVGCEILLYMASRTQLMAEVIAPALERRQCVLCDRWVSSTVAYQVAEGRATAAEVLEIYELALRKRRPDLTIILDVPAETGLARVTGQPDRIEAKGLEFHRKVRRLFLEQAEADPEAFRILDAAGTAEEVQKRLQGLLEEWSSAY